MSGLREALANVVRSSTKREERAYELAHPRALSALVVGQRFTLHRDCCESQADLERVFEVVRVTPGSAVVRALSGRKVEIRDDEGKVKASWEAPGRTFTMSVEASVVVQVQQ